MARHCVQDGFPAFLIDEPVRTPFGLASDSSSFHEQLVNKFLDEVPGWADVLYRVAIAVQRSSYAAACLTGRAHANNAADAMAAAATHAVSILFQRCGGKTRSSRSIQVPHNAIDAAVTTLDRVRRTRSAPQAPRSHSGSSARSLTPE
jgi:hypothetical protein